MLLYISKKEWNWIKSKQNTTFTTDLTLLVVEKFTKIMSCYIYQPKFNVLCIFKISAKQSSHVPLSNII